MFEGARLNRNALFTAGVLGRPIDIDVSNAFEPASLTPVALETGAARMHASSLKRAMDVLVAGCGLLFLAPVLLLVALVIRLETPGPVLFRQRRTGRGGKIFYMYKFRSMYATEDGAAIKQATPDDPRITRFGAFLRRTSIDEIPQLLNVLKNDMSLIGPRPHAVAHDVLYGALIDEYRLRFLAKPGISGLAQVSGHRGATPDSEAMARRVALDLDYIASWSFALDIRILIRTVLTGPFHPAAY
jgi:putative colanic acid biosynthesis UDP-glucose lipid carrier transferase